MASFVVCLWLLTVLVIIPVTAWKGIPILEAFGPYDTRQGAVFAKVMLGIVLLLVGLDALTDQLIAGQRPFVWAMVVALQYAWVTIIYRLLRAR